jgi:hypothetical protein
MRSPFYFLVKPVDGKRYTNQRDNGLIVSSSQEDHTQTNRLALVVNTPVGYDGPVQIGDQILVHHNVFRIYYDMQGRERSSFNHIIDDVYYIEPDQFYMYIRDGVKMAVSPFVFIRPVSNKKEMSVYTQGIHKELAGEVAYSSEEYLSPGEVVSFKPHSEYEFYIDGEKLYRMSHNNVCIKL